MPLTVFFEVFDKLFRWPRDEQMDPLQQNTYTKKVIYIYIYIYIYKYTLPSKLPYGVA